LSIGPDQWVTLQDVQVGQRIPLSVGNNVWASEYVPVKLPLHAYVSGIRAVAITAGVNGRSVYRWLNGERSVESSSIAVAIERTGSQNQEREPCLPSTMPVYITEQFAAFLGYLIGDGNIYLSKAAIGFTSGDRDAADRYASLVTDLFGIKPPVFWDKK